MNKDVELAMRFLSLTHASLYTEIRVFSTSRALWVDTSSSEREITSEFLSARPTRSLPSHDWVEALRPDLRTWTGFANASPLQSLVLSATTLPTGVCRVSPHAPDTGPPSSWSPFSTKPERVTADSSPAMSNPAEMLSSTSRSPAVTGRVVP